MLPERTRQPVRFGGDGETREADRFEEIKGG